MNYYTDVLKKYVVFSGRATRQEYWMFALFSFIISLALGFISIPIHSIVLIPIYSLAVLIPSLAVAVRRLHDTGRSGWWIFISLVPVIGVITLIILLVLDSQPGSNEYGPDPKSTAV